MRINENVSESLSEYLIQPQETPKGVNRDNVSLATKIGDVELELPFLSAAMGSVTGRDLALELARLGGLPDVPCHGVSIDDQCDIVQAVHSDRMRLIEDPTVGNPEQKVVSVLDQVAEHGHSNILIVDKFRQLKGVFNTDDFNKNDSDEKITRGTPVSKVMHHFSKDGDIPYEVGDRTVDEVKTIFDKREDISYLVLVDESDRLLKVAFRKDMKEKKIAGAIGTRGDWLNRARNLAEAGVSIISIDTSDAHGYYVQDVLKKYKADSVLKDIPIIAGNVVTAKAFRYLAEAGADAIKGGMGIGSICTTPLVKGMGRGQFTVAYELSQERDAYYKTSGNYVPLIIDGGIKNTANMAVALSMVDAIMLGRMFNQFYEAAGDKLNASEKPSEGEPIVYVRTWGEGSSKAVNLMRYEIPELRKFYQQGVEGIVPYEGRLKPGVERWADIIGDVLIGSGANTLEEYRGCALLEKMSEGAQREAGAHSIKVT